MISDRAQRAADAAEQVARDRAHPRWPLYLFAGLVIAAAIVLGVLQVQSKIRSDSMQQQITALDRDAKEVAGSLDQLCEQDPSVRARAGEACRKADEVQRNAPAAAVNGTNGADGRGIVATAIEQGRLFVSYSDGQKRDVGQVVGANGTPGPVGQPGRGVTGTVLSGTDLVVVYSDGQREDLGRIVGRDGTDGAPGRGITSVDGSSGRLLITFTDGTTQDAGELPRGPQGAPGQPGPQGSPPASWTVTRADGSTERCTRDSGPDSAPTYSCTGSSGTVPDPVTSTTTETSTVTATPELPLPTTSR